MVTYMITICKSRICRSCKTGDSPLRLFAVAAPNGNPQPVAQKIVHILSTGRRFVLHPVALRHDSHNRLGSQPASGVIIQMEIDGFHMGVVLQKPGEGHRQLAFLDLFLRLVHPGKGQQIVPPPVNPVQLAESGISKHTRWGRVVNGERGAFSPGDRNASGDHPKGARESPGPPEFPPF